MREFATRVDGRKQADDEGRYGQRFVLTSSGHRRCLIKPETYPDCRHKQAKDNPHTGPAVSELPNLRDIFTAIPPAPDLHFLIATAREFRIGTIFTAAYAGKKTSSTR